MIICYINLKNRIILICAYRCFRCLEIPVWHAVCMSGVKPTQMHMKKTVLILSLALISLGAAAAKHESRFVVCDSTHALLNGVKMEFVNINHIPLMSSYDGLIRFAFPSNVSAAQVMLTGEGLDTLRMTIAPTECPQWIIMKRKAQRFDGAPSDVYYTMGAPSAKMLSRKDVRTLAGRKTGVMAEVETLAVMEDAAAPAEFDVAEESLVRPLPATNNVQAGKLTAGEVNDFAKWHLWNNILTQSHAQFVNEWKMNVSRRIRVQVTNKQQFPLADVPVVLLDANGHELFAARTDNTGHAELWADVFHSSRADKLSDTYQLSINSQIVNCPIVNNEAFCVLDTVCDTPDNVDVFFIMDATGSMGDELRYMNAELQDVIRRSQSAVDGAIIRTGALVYRDHHDDYLNRLSMLTEDMSVTQMFLNEQRAGGGGDYEEAVPEALMAAVNVADWSTHARARIAFLILDAPCHQDSATIALLHAQVKAAAKQGIRVVPVVCSGLRESGELLMRELALLTNGTSFFLTDDSGIGDKHLKPITDSLKVEHLNDMLVRTIIEFSRMPQCQPQWADSALAPTDEEAFLPNPFDPEDLDTIPQTAPVRPLDEVLTVRPNPCDDFFLADLPLGADALFLVDLTGKTLQNLGPQRAESLTVNVGAYPTGIYFLKAFVGGNWYTRKIIVR